MSAPLGASIPAEAGIGLRFPHHRAVLEDRPRIAWMEVHPENYMGGGLALAHLKAIRRDYPVSFHGVGLSLGSAEGIDMRHLERLADLVDRLEPGLVSEHVSWSIVDGTYLADLLPLPMTQEALDVVCRNVNVMQDRLRRQVLAENPSSYLRFRHSTIPEWEFMAAIAQRTGCGLLCDVNNIFVCAQNHGFDAYQYLRSLPPHSIGEMHVAGHSVRNLDTGNRIRIDDHSREVSAEVWDLLDAALAWFGPVPTLVEWDTNVPPLPVLLSQAEKAQRRLTAAAEVADAAIA